MANSTPCTAPRVPQASCLLRARAHAGRALGLADVRIADVDLSSAEAGLQAWLDAGMHGDMDYMAAHGMKRARPAELVPGTLRVISARVDYLPRASAPDWREREQAKLAGRDAAVVSIYARWRDYHKVLRGKLQQLASRIEAEAGVEQRRLRVDVPRGDVLEVERFDQQLRQLALGIGLRGHRRALVGKPTD